MCVVDGIRGAGIGLCVAVLGLLAFQGCGEDKAAEGPASAKAVDDRLEQFGLTPEQAAKPVAKVGERVITVGEVTDQINRLSPYIRRRWADPEKRKEFLQKLVRVELLSLEAERLGLGQDPEVQRTVKQVMIRLMIKNDLEKDLLPTTIDEKILKADYDKEIDKYHRAAQVRASQIVVKTRAEAEKLIAQAKKNSEDRKFFREQAKQLSLDAETKERGGDLGYFSKPEERRDDEPAVPEAVARAAWSLQKVGDVADQPVETDQGFHVVTLTNKKPEMNRSFESVKRLIENRLLRDARSEAMDKFVAELRAKADVKFYDDNLAQVRIPADEPGHQHHGGVFSEDIPDSKLGGPAAPGQPVPGDQEQ
jgi:parvulin-like peptidyl-prolyl isomerase